jgi:RNA polymerase sigma factor (sigma-70 family)
MSSVLAKRLVKHDVTVPVEKLSDEDLLERFLKGEGFESQEAFRTLVVRHGPMVLGICRHVLNHEADAEDAFQATFLVLARKAASIRNRRFPSAWLHEVAFRIACKARGKEVRRSHLEKLGMAMSPRTIENNDPQETAAWNELRPILHEEVNCLPEKFRILVILSYLEGKTNEEVAELLRCPVGTVKGRLSRAREVLRRRLIRRGMVLSAAFLMTALSRGIVFAEVVPAELINRSVRLVGTFSRRSRPFFSTPSSAQSSAETRIKTAFVSLTNIYGKYVTFVYIIYSVFFIFLLVAMTIGIGLTVGTDANSSYLRKAFSGFTPWRATGSSCH